MMMLVILVLVPVLGAALVFVGRTKLRGRRGDHGGAARIGWYCYSLDSRWLVNAQDIGLVAVKDFS
jgi:hypothetical protein